MNGSMNEDNLFIVHDDSVLMTVKETITRMKENNYFHHWLLTMNGFQDGTHYYRIPVGNIPQFITLDNILNR